MVSRSFFPLQQGIRGQDFRHCWFGSALLSVLLVLPSVSSLFSHCVQALFLGLSSLKLAALHFLGGERGKYWASVYSRLDSLSRSGGDEFPINAYLVKSLFLLL